MEQRWQWIEEGLILQLHTVHTQQGLAKGGGVDLVLCVCVCMCDSTSVPLWSVSARSALYYVY